MISGKSSDEKNKILSDLGLKIRNKVNFFSLPIKYYSWTLLSPEIFIKDMDKSSFNHHGTGIPKEIRNYFDCDRLMKGEKKQAIFVFDNKSFDVHFQLTTLDRTRLFWKKDFVDIINNELSEWNGINIKSIKNVEEVPKMRLVKSFDQKSTYYVNFINPRDIIFDVNSEKEEYPDPKSEGAEIFYYGKRYERDIENRKNTIAYHGYRCIVCEFDFEEKYGVRGKGFIEIHHVRPLSSLGKEMKIDARTDMVPVCANCHRMIHRRNDDVLSIEELKKIKNNK